MRAAYSIENVLKDTEHWQGGYVNGVNVSYERQFPPSRLADDRPGRVCRMGGVSGLPFSFGAILKSKRTVDCIAIINHNLSYDLRVTFGASETPSVDDTSILFPVRPGESSWLTFPEVAGVGYVSAVPESYPTATTDGRRAEVGLFWVGKMALLPSAMQWGDESGWDQITGFQETEYGAPIAYALSERRAYSGRLQRGLRAAGAQQMEAFHRAVRGRVRPFLFAPSVAGQDVILGRLGSDSFRSRSLTPTRVDALDLSVVEDPWGLTGA